jgi:hypothetical protein
LKLLEKEKTIFSDTELIKLIDIIYDAYISEYSNSKESTTKTIKCNTKQSKDSIKYKKANSNVKIKLQPTKNQSAFEMHGLILEKMKEYNCFNDIHLNSFLSINDRKNILIKNGLLTKEGYIVYRPNDYLKKMEMCKKMMKPNENLLKTTGKLILMHQKSPYYSNLYQNYNQRLYEKAKLHETLVIKPKNAKVLNKETPLSELALQQQSQKSKKIIKKSKCDESKLKKEDQLNEKNIPVIEEKTKIVDLSNEEEIYFAECYSRLVNDVILEIIEKFY